MEVLKICITSFFSAITLFVIAKILGHKQMSQLDFFDYITGITIGSIAAEMATDLEKVSNGFFAMLIYGIVAYTLTWLAHKFPKMRKYINGTPTIIMDDGKLNRQNMKKAKIELSEFLVMCRQEGFFNLDDIKTAVFEYNGRLTILPKSSKKALTPEDINAKVDEEVLHTEIIMDGQILHENIKRLGFNLKWLENELKNQNYKKAKEIFLGLYDNNGKVKFYPYPEK